MTRRAARQPARGLPRIWLLPALILTVVLGLTAADFFSRSLVLDLVAWWPAWLLLVLVSAVFGRRRVGRLRVGGLVSILVSAVLVLFVVAHVSGWPVNPSATRYLVGPDPAGFEEAEIIALVGGQLRVADGSSFLYEVDPMPGGGSVGMPSAIERTIQGTVSVRLDSPADPGFDTSAGWDLSLSPLPRWALVLGGEVEADLTGLTVDSLDLSGAGRVGLGVVTRSTVLSVEGAFRLDVPGDVPVVVFGDARVPDSWIETSDGWRSPTEGEGWVVTISPDSVVAIDQG